jgi:phosphoribosylformimino-5-aminoimidazole carboxamide ribotide isomerase
MQLVPVLEIRRGKCVHIEPDRKHVKKVIKEEAIDMVDTWVKKGVSRIHIVDVDAIESGEPVNVDLVSKIKQQYPELSIQVLGGINCVDSAYIWNDAGADSLVLNGKSIRRRNLLSDICMEFPDKILIELDCRQGDVGMGSGEPTMKLTCLAKQLEEDGVAGLVVTELEQDSNGKNNSLLDIGELCKAVDIPIYANVGIRKAEDLRGVLELQVRQPCGILIGKAIYNGFSLNEASGLIENYQPH